MLLKKYFIWENPDPGGSVDESEGRIFNSFYHAAGWLPPVDPVEEYYNPHGPNEVFKIFPDATDACPLIIKPIFPFCDYIQGRSLRNKGFITEKQYNLILYPNPSNEFITIENAELDSRLIICNIMGEIMIDEKIINSSFHVDIKEFSPGIYIIRNENGKSATFIKL